MRPSLAANQPVPTAGFPQLFKTHFDFVNKILARLGGFGFAINCVRRRAASQNLSSDVIAGAGVREFFREINYSGREFKQSILEIVLLFT